MVNDTGKSSDDRIYSIDVNKRVKNTTATGKVNNNNSIEMSTQHQQNEH